MKRSDREIGIHSAVLASLMIVLVLTPLVGPSAGGQSLIASGGWSALIATCFLLAQRRGRIVLLLLIIPGVFLQWLAGYEVQTLAARGAILAVMALLLVRSVFRAPRVGLDHVLGGIAAYLLVGVAFTEVHHVVLLDDPDAYLQGGVSLVEVAASGAAPVEEALMYYSFTTFTTLGYGDIAPSTGAARIASTAEAIVGQLFIAILIARLVAGYSAPRLPARPGSGGDGIDSVSSEALR